MSNRSNSKNRIIFAVKIISNMLTFFPKFFTNRAILCYLLTLIIASLMFINYAMPFQFMLFGLAAVFLFFFYTNKLSLSWRRLPPRRFVKNLFITALIIRIIYVIFIYFYYIKMTGRPNMYYPGDELMYEYFGSVFAINGIDAFRQQMKVISLSDSGYCWWTGIVYSVFGVHVLSDRIVKCFVDAFAGVLMYNLGKRNFGEFTGRMAAIFYMMMPNMWYYCGLSLKETIMVFLVILFVERGDLVMHSRKVLIKDLLLPALIILVVFTFRTALAAVLFAALIAALILSSGKQLEPWKKFLYGSIFAVWMFMTVGVEIIQETQELWEGRTDNQSVGYEWRSETNSFAQYASAAVFAPAIFTIPFSTLIHVAGQENQMMLNGANFIKNIMSGFTIFAMFSLLFSGEWRKHVLPIALACGYLVVLVFSNFAHSERFHFPVLGLELLFAAYGVSLVKNKQKRWYTLWVIGISLANIAWAYIKLAGRGLSV